MNRRSRSHSTAVNPPAAKGALSWRRAAVFSLLLFATLTAYLPSLAGGFLWDDAGHVTAPALQTWSGLLRTWVQPGATQQYYPLLHSAFWFEHRLWGDAALGYRLVNVLWHATSAYLLIALLRRLAIPGALFAGFVFVLHPVAVESVAWIAEQKNTLSTVFYLAAALAWLRFEEQRGRARYLHALLWFTAALLTKSVTATLPATLLVLAWWRRGRLSWRGDVAPLLPWLALGLAAGFGTTWMETHQIGASGAEFSLTFVQRALLAGRVVWFYLGKLVWPFGLTFFYPRWTIDAAAAWQWLFPAATLLALAAGVWFNRRNRGLLAAMLLFGGTLAPVLGFVNVYPFVFSYVADHFQYLASLGMIAFLVASASHGFARLHGSRWTAPTLATVFLLPLGVLTWRQSGMYRDIFSLYETTLARNPTSWVAHLNLGTALDDAGRPDESLPHLQRALELKPDHPETLNSLGRVLNQLGRPQDALPLLQRALQREPHFASAANTLGATLMALGREAEGQAAFERAIAIDPTLVLPRVNLGWAHANAGHFDDAFAQFAQAQRLQPDSANLEFKWGLALVMKQRTAEAKPHLAKAVELSPAAAEMRRALGVALLETGDPAGAEEQFQAVLQLNPNDPGAQAGLEAVSHLRRR